MILVGISGAIDHGKTTLAEFLVDAAPSASHFESSEIIMEVANALRASSASPSAEDMTAITAWLQALPQILADCVHVNIRFSDLQITPEGLQSGYEFATLIAYLRLMELQPELLEKPINSSNKDDFRPLLQWLGGYIAKKISGRLWYNEIIRRGKASGAELVVSGGVRFPEDAACLRNAGGIIISINRPSMNIPMSDDVTERERTEIIPDVTVINDGSLQALKLVAKEVYDDIAAGHAKPMYMASNFEPKARTGLSLAS